MIKLKQENNKSDYSNIMKNLSLWVPREYFLELQFCARTIASILATIFPPLVLHVEQLTYIEWLLYMEPGYLKYRDHLVHLFKVAFAGHKMLTVDPILKEITKFQFNSRHFIEWCESRSITISNLFDKEKEEIIKLSFFLAALFHDFGYSYYYHNRYQERLSKINSWLQPNGDLTNINTPFFKKLKTSLPYFFVEKNHAEYLEKVVNKQQKELLMSGFFRDCLPLNHSIASSFAILNIAEELWDTGALSEKLYLAFQLAAEAIMIHDMTGENNWLHLKLANGNKDLEKKHFLNANSFKSLPIALLLVFSDELAIWKRHRIIPDHSKGPGKVAFEINKKNVCKSIDINLQDCKIVIKTNPKPPEDKDDLKKKFKEDLKYLFRNCFMGKELEFK